MPIWDHIRDESPTQTGFPEPPENAEYSDTPVFNSDGSVRSYGWSAEFPVPVVSTKVHVDMNGLGLGNVKSYFYAAGYVGVEVKLDNPPEWYVKQNGGNVLARVYGREISLV